MLLRMSASLQVILFWMLTTFALNSIPLVSCAPDDDRVITIDKAGVGSTECCVHGKCHCSDLSLALEHIQSNTDIRIMSNIPLQGAINNSNVIEMLNNPIYACDVSPFVWLHEFILQFSHTITECVNNLYGPAKVFMCCDDDYSCDERYEYFIDHDSTHNTITMISNNTVTRCPNNGVCTFQLVATANVNSTLVSIHISIKLSLSNGLVGSCEEDIAHVKFSDPPTCRPLSCNLRPLPGINCEGSEGDGYFYVIPGYWFSNGFMKYTSNCPPGHCNSAFDLYASIYYNNLNSNNNFSFPNSNNQCFVYWTGLACGECDNYIIHDSTRCVPSSMCTLKEFSGLFLFFFVSLLYWIIVISFIFVLLHFKFDITAGYAYGILFYYSVLEQTVNASYAGTQNNLNNSIIILLLTILSSIGNMKPPFQLLKLCFWKNAMMMDHMFLTYFHPVIVTSLIVTIFLLARNSVTVARIIGRYVNSKSICILLILSYSSVSYTSVQLLRPLAVYNYCGYTYCSTYSWHLYLSPTIKYFDKYFAVYFIIALLCELIIGIGFPFVLAFQQYFTRYLSINFTSIKPIIDQLKGCYKEEYRWFAAYYLVCRQLIYVVDIGTDFIPDFSLQARAPAKFPIMLAFYIFIIIVHISLQPYKQRILNVLDSCILTTLMLVFIGEHVSYGSTVVFWFFPLVLFINLVTFSTKFKHLLIPISCLVIIASSCLVPFTLLPELYINYYFLSDISFYYINFVVILPTFVVFLAYMVYLCVIGMKRCCKLRAQYKFVNEHNEDSHEDSDSTSHSYMLYSSSL